MQISPRVNIRTSKSTTEDEKTLLAYSHYLIMKAQLEGNFCFDGHKPTAEEIRVAEQCRQLCGKIHRRLNVCRITYVPELLEYYDIAYRIGNNTVPDTEFINSQKKRVFKAWKEGNKEIPESTIFGMISPLVAYHPENADRDYIALYHTIKQRWITTLRKNDSFPKTTSYENYQRLALMMRENLDCDLGNDADSMKRLWYEHNSVDDLTVLGTQLLRSYRRFASSLFPSVLDYEEVTTLDNRILSELSTRRDLPPQDREAFRMALEFNQELTKAYQ